MNSCNSGSASSLECQAAPGTISNSSVEKKLSATALTLLYCQAAEAVPALGRVALGRRLREGGKGAEDECGCCCTAFPVHTTSFCAALLQAAFQERTSDRGVDRRGSRPGLDEATGAPAGSFADSTGGDRSTAGVQDRGRPD